MEYFDPLYIAVAGFFGCIGTGAVMYGTKAADFQSLIVGLLLCGVSYFVTNPLVLFIISLVLCVMLFSRQIMAYSYAQKNKNIPEIK